MTNKRNKMHCLMNNFYMDKDINLIFEEYLHVKFYDM